MQIPARFAFRCQQTRAAHSRLSRYPHRETIRVKYLPQRQHPTWEPLHYELGSLSITYTAAQCCVKSEGLVVFTERTV
uniref:Uncharacterized protein n=1 Tax=Anguilla anguilla TaxID=7936 RepID=A0A0E9Q6U3_ANGAN